MKKEVRSKQKQSVLHTLTWHSLGPMDTATTSVAVPASLRRMASCVGREGWAPHGTERARRNETNGGAPSLSRHATAPPACALLLLTSTHLQRNLAKRVDRVPRAARVDSAAVRFHAHAGRVIQGALDGDQHLHRE